MPDEAIVPLRRAVDALLDHAMAGTEGEREKGDGRFGAMGPTRQPVVVDGRQTHTNTGQDSRGST